MARILAGLCVHEAKTKTGACFYDKTNRAVGPVFNSLEEAESFLSFIGGLDPADLDWNPYVDCETGERLLKMWLDEGKPKQRKTFQFDAEKEITKDDSEDAPKRWSFQSELHWECFPLFLGVERGCEGVEKFMRRDGVLTPDDETDTERSFFRAFFKTKAQGHAFVGRLNAWLRENWHKAYPDTKK